MKDFESKIAVITGAGSGIGRALAVQLAGLGATVIMSDKNKSSLDETKALIEVNRGICHRYVVDAGDKAQIASFAREVLAVHKHVDLLINNAGMAIGEASLNEVHEDDFERLINVNLWGVIHHSRALLDSMLSRPEAAIVNISSVFGLFGVPMQIPYCVSKYAVRGFSEALRMELVDTNVSVTCVHPGGIKTNIVKNGVHYKKEKEINAKFDKMAMTSADKAAADIIKAIQRKAKRVMVGPDAKLIRLLSQAAPGLIDRYLQTVKNQFKQ